MNGVVWCGYSPGRFRNVGSMERCPKDSHELTHIDLYSQNAEFFGCATCEHVDTSGCRAWCVYDPRLKRLIASWGYCPRYRIEGPCRAWNRRKEKFR